MRHTRADAVRNYFDKRLWLNSEIEINNRIEIVNSLLQGVENKKILDIGCGDGRISLQFEKRNSLLLLDVSQKMLENAKNNVKKDGGNIRLVQADFLEYNTDEKFDVVICIGVLAHVRSVEETLIKISSVLTNGGICIIQFTNCANLVGWLNRNYYDLKAILKHTRSYNLNKVNIKKIKKISSDLGWRNTAMMQYFSSSPIASICLKLLGNKDTVYFRSRKLNNLLSPEIIMCYEKSA